MKRILTFGTFEYIDNNYLLYLHKIKSYGDKLHAAITNDKDFEILKNRKATYNENIRLCNAINTKIVNYAYIEDSNENWKSLLDYNFNDKIVISTNQYSRFGNELEKLLETYKLDIEVLAL